MKIKILSIVITSLLTFGLICTVGIPIAYENVFAQGEGSGGMTGSGDNETTGEMTNGNNATGGGMSEGKTDPNGEATDLCTGGP
jgi:hypothetical protein